MKIIFLDRDGVINKFPGNGLYVTTLTKFKLLPRSLKAIRLLTEAGYEIFVISNQAGVAKGIYTKEKLDRINQEMIKGVAKSGGALRGVYYCTHRSDAGCLCRKPEIGNIRKALKSIGRTIRSAKGCFFIGDTKSDILAGFNAKCKTILVLSGRAKKEQVKNWGVKPDFIVKDLLEAVDIVLADREPPRDRTEKHTEYLKKNGIKLKTALLK
jgi:D-glycero-D-manno-heptose 1,7-bisphosphate phosphatase